VRTKFGEKRIKLQNLLSSLPPGEMPFAEKFFEEKMRRKKIEEALQNVLNPREARVIRVLYGIPHLDARFNERTNEFIEKNKNKQVSLEEAGKFLIISDARVAQLRNRALDKLRNSWKYKRVLESFLR
jgi:DNA-directed RNA polymerase sigma subunit (sigma70/sigma32)